MIVTAVCRVVMSSPSRSKAVERCAVRSRNLPENNRSAPILNSLLHCHSSRRGSNLQPIAKAHKGIHAVLALHHHAFKVECFQKLKQLLTTATDVIDIE